MERRVQEVEGFRPGSRVFHEGSGYYYRVKKLGVKNMALKCCVRGCPVRALTPRDPEERYKIKVTVGVHNHPPNKYKIEANRVRQKLMQRSMIESTPFKQIFNEEMVRVPDEVKKELKYLTVCRSMQHARTRAINNQLEKMSPVYLDTYEHSYAINVEVGNCRVETNEALVEKSLEQTSLPSTSYEQKEVHPAERIRRQVVIIRKSGLLYGFTDDQRLEFSDAIGDAILKLPDGSDVPRFQSIHCRDNHLLVTPVDQFSKRWLLMNISSLDVWPDVELAAIEAYDFLKPKRKALLWIPGKRVYTNTEVLAIIQRQNSGLQASSWRVLNRVEENNKGLRLTIEIDKVAIQSLKKINFQPYYKAERGKITLINVRKEPATSTSDQTVGSSIEIDGLAVESPTAVYEYLSKEITREADCS